MLLLIPFEHSILLNILQQDFGVVGTALNWFDSFLSGRKQRILVGDKTSDDFNLNCRVPPGSCMGPILFTIYVSRLFNLISQHLPSVHGYADDTQITSPSDLVLSIRKSTLSL